jgi:hypothetical protein
MKEQASMIFRKEKNMLTALRAAASETKKTSVLIS